MDEEHYEHHDLRIFLHSVPPRGGGCWCNCTVRPSVRFQHARQRRTDAPPPFYGSPRPTARQRAFPVHSVQPVAPREEVIPWFLSYNCASCIKSVFVETGDASSNQQCLLSEDQ